MPSVGIKPNLLLCQIMGFDVIIHVKRKKNLTCLIELLK